MVVWTFFFLKNRPAFDDITELSLLFLLGMSLWLRPQSGLD